MNMMIATTELYSIDRITLDNSISIEDIIIKEFPLTIVFNNQELVTLLCSPLDLDCLAVGYLSSEGFLHTKDEIKKIIVDEQRGIVRVNTYDDRAIKDDLQFKRFITSGCGRGASFYNVADVQREISIESDIKIPAFNIFKLVKEFQQRSQIYRITHGVHSAALCDIDNILVFNEDIGRHNAIDKIFGECLLNDIPVDNRLIITTGRISSEILLKVAVRNIPILISKSAPTNLGVKLANELGITLIGFVRGKKMNCYTNCLRIIEPDK
jgi:FdhD protein